MRPLSLHHLTMLDATPAELIAAAAEGGFDFAGLRIVSPDTGLPFGDLITDPTARRRLRARIADLPGGIWDVEAIWLRPGTDVAALAPALETARDLGARFVLTVGHDHDRGRLVDHYGALAELAADAGVRLVIEPITYCAVNDVPAAQDVIASVGRDDVAILVDALQFFRSGVGLGALRAGPPSLFPYAQIADGPAGAPDGVAALRNEARTDRLVPGAGEFDLRGWLSALPAQVPLAVEVPSSAVRALPRGAAARMLRQAVDGLLGDEAA